MVTPAVGVQRGRGYSSRSTTIPAPVGGWNARDSLDAMPRTDAVFLDNIFPTTTGVEIRKGYALHAELPADTVEDPHNIRSLMYYSSPDASNNKLFAGCEDGIYDVTDGGVIDTPSSAATSGEWSSTNITTAGGSFLWCANGVDDARYFDGSAWTILNDSSSPALTGIESNKITHVNLFKFQMVFCCKDSLSFWHLPANSVAGEASEFPLGPLFKKGGYLVATSSWTLDGGNGPDDYFIAITSEGEVAIYQGTDPGSADTWALVGVYYIGKPLGNRCFEKIGGDLMVLTDQGLYPLSRSLLLASAENREAISDKIAGAWIEFAREFGDLYGWQVIFYPSAPFVLVNVPVLQNPDFATGMVSYQFVMNTNTKAWCRFTQQSSEAWVVAGKRLFFAGHNFVYEAWTGQDNAGTAIDARAQQAFTYLAGRDRITQVQMVQPITVGSAQLDFQMGIEVDFEYTFGLRGSLFSYVEKLSLWDQALWDQGRWYSGSLVQKSWKTIFCKAGRATSFRLRVNAKGVTLKWTTTGLIYHLGGMM